MADVFSDPDKKVPLQDIIEQFMALQKSPQTKKAYRGDLRQFLTFLELEEQPYGAFLNIPFPEMTARISSFLEGFKTRSEDGKVLNPNTFNRKRYTLVSFFRFLIETYDYRKNPATLLPVLPKADQSNTPALFEPEIKATMRHMKARMRLGKKQYRDYLIVLGLFHFALRRHELASLKWTDIFLHPIPHFRLQGKGNKMKYLPIPPKYMARLDEFVEQYGKPCHYIFHPIKNNRHQNAGKTPFYQCDPGNCHQGDRPTISRSRNCPTFVPVILCQSRQDVWAG